MKITITVLLALFMGFKALGQVGIGIPVAAPSSVLEVSSENKGITFPHVALTGVGDKLTVPNPANGTTVFNTSTTNGMTTGIYFWNTYLGAGGQWERLLDSDTNVNISYLKEEDTSIIKNNHIFIINSGYPRELSTSPPANNNKFNVTILKNTASYLYYSNMAPGGNNMGAWQSFPRDNATSPYMDLGTSTRAGTFTVPADDNYQITCGAYVSHVYSGVTANIALYMEINNSTNDLWKDSKNTRGLLTSDLEYTYTGPLKAGDKIKCYILQNSPYDFKTQSVYFYASYIR